jgi:hypothetical protein
MIFPEDFVDAAKEAAVRTAVMLPVSIGFAAAVYAAGQWFGIW